MSITGIATRYDKHPARYQAAITLRQHPFIWLDNRPLLEAVEAAFDDLASSVDGPVEVAGPFLEPGPARLTLGAQRRASLSYARSA
ncbi:hypothetical protein [Streptomyces sp. NPDC097619]|uniref:hypothetical protein n=1 Tax=Streptomyces sp. NPDC097619 TaxID=3157228 RepID=UPI0033248703